MIIITQSLLLHQIVITFYSPTCLGPETAKGPFGLRVKLPPVYHTRWRLHTVPLIAERQAGKLVSTNFYSLWFDPTGNRTRVYRFSSRRSIHSTTDIIYQCIYFNLVRAITMNILRFFLIFRLGFSFKSLLGFGLDSTLCFRVRACTCRPSCNSVCRCIYVQKPCFHHFFFLIGHTKPSFLSIFKQRIFCSS